MKANELRTGNNLQRSDGSIITVKRLIYNDNDILVNETHGLFTLGYTALPIPLTEEILLKCGFEIRKDGKLWHEELSLYEVDFFLNSKSDIIKHLHQLQNLFFALTGKELEVKI